MDHDPSSEPLAQAKATHRHIRRLRAAERRHGQREHRADAAAVYRANSEPADEFELENARLRSDAAAAARLAVEQDLIALDRSSLVADPDAVDIDPVDL